MASSTNSQLSAYDQISGTLGTVASGESAAW